MDYADVPGMDLNSRVFLKARKVVNEEEVPDAVPSKKTRIEDSGKHSFVDSAFLLQGLSHTLFLSSFNSPSSRLDPGY